MPNLQLLARLINGRFDKEKLSIPEVRELFLNPNGNWTGQMREAQQYMTFQITQHGLSEEEQEQLRDLLWCQNQALSLGAAS